MAELLRDTFTAPNQPLTTYNSNYIPETGNQGNARLVNNAVVFDTGGFSSTELYHRGDISIPDGGWVEATFAASNTSGTAAVVLFLDESNKYLFLHVSNEVFIARTRQGSYQVVSSRAAPPTPITDGVTVRLRKTGTTLEAYWGDLDTPLYTYTNANNDFGGSGLNPGMEIVKADLILDDFVADDGIAGAVPAGTVTVSPAQGVTHNSASLPFSYDNTDQTGFEYRVDSGTPISISASPVSLTGLAAETSYSVQVRAVNANGAGAWSTARSFTTSAAPSLPPQGTVTLNANNITVTETTATVPVQYSASDQTGFEYRLDGGSPVAFASSPATITSLNSDTTYSIEVRAVNANGQSAWSTAVNFTTSAPVAVPSITSEPLRRNNGTLVTNTTCDVYVLNTATHAIVYSEAGVTVNSSGVFTVSDASLTASTEYFVSWVESTGQARLPKATAS